MSLRERTRPGLGIIEPCLPSPAKAPPSGLGWLHEIKHDGFRIVAGRDAAGPEMISRLAFLSSQWRSASSRFGHA
jgi:ATP-dependent DNA ligase